MSAQVQGFKAAPLQSCAPSEPRAPTMENTPTYPRRRDMWATHDRLGPTCINSRRASADSSHGLANGGGALQLVPGERAAFHGALERLEQHDGKQLTVGKPLQPHVSQEQ